MRNMISYLKDSLSKSAIKFLKKRNYVVISKKEYEYLNKGKTNYMASKPVEDKEPQEKKEFDPVEKFVSRAKEVIERIEKNKFHYEYELNEPSENQSDDVKHMLKLIKLIETDSYEKGIIKKIMEQKREEDIKDLKTNIEYFDKMRENIKKDKTEKKDHYSVLEDSMPPELVKAIKKARTGKDENLQKDLDV